MSIRKFDEMLEEEAERAFELEYVRLVPIDDPDLRELLESFFRVGFFAGASYINENLEEIEEALNQEDN